MTTLAQAKAILRPLGIVIKSLPEYREYRVSFRQRPGIPRTRYEDTAYYANDIDDAVATGRHMAAHMSLAGLRHGNRRRRSRAYGSSDVWFDPRAHQTQVRVGRYRVSTNYTLDEGWETMVFDMKRPGPYGAGLTVDKAHYRTQAEARAGHARMVAKWSARAKWWRFGDAAGRRG